MADQEPRRNVLLYLAAEGVIPVLGGCAGALAAGPVAGVAGVAVGHAVEKAINLFGRGIVGRWQAWFARHRPEAERAVAELAGLPPAEARAEAKSILLDLAPDADANDLELAVEFLSAIPRAVDRALVPDPSGAGRSLPATVAFEDARSLLQLLPEDVPPYRDTADLPGTPYRLVELLGSGGFGAVYRAVSPTLQHLPLAVKFCLDRSLLPTLNQERSNLERLMRAGGRGSAHVVRLYGYDLDHPTPYLVYEYVPGGDLTRLLAARKAALGRAPDPAEVLGWVTQIAEGLAFAHRTGLVHRDLKPANVLADGDTLKLADFGLGGVAAVRAAARSRIGTTTLDYLSLADQASLFRGAGTPLYMSPEQRRGAPPDPRHDLYALGVVWYQLLIGDVSRELHPGWAKELAVRFGVPPAHIGLIERCVGWFDERPKDAGELLPLLHEAAGQPVPPAPPPLPASEPIPSSPAADTALNASQVTPTPLSTTGRRRLLLVSMVGKLDAAYARVAELQQAWKPAKFLAWGVPLALAGAAAGAGYQYSEEIKYQARYQVHMGVVRPLGWDAVAGAGLLVGLGVWAAVVVVAWLATVGRAWFLARRRVPALVNELATDFPDAVAAWGGRPVLREAGIVRSIRDELSPPPVPPLPPAEPPSPTSVLSPDEVTSDTTRRAILVARMREHLNLLRDTKSNLDGTWIGLVMLYFFLLPAAGGGVLYASQKWFDVDKGLSVLPAAVAVVAAGGLIWLAMAEVRRHLRRKWTDAGNRFAADYPRLVEAWGGPQVLRSGETLEALLRTYDPAAVPGRGLFGRLFGG